MMRMKRWQIAYTTGATVVCAVAVLLIFDGVWLGALAGGASGLAGGLGGLGSLVSGALGGGGGAAMETLSALSSAGLSTDQSKSVGLEVLNFAKEKAGDGLVGEITSSIPGLDMLL